jgi:hypothetical protein
VGPQAVNKHLNGTAGKQLGLHLTCRMTKEKQKREGGVRGAMEGGGLQFLQTGRGSIEKQNWGGGGEEQRTWRTSVLIRLKPARNLGNRLLASSEFVYYNYRVYGAADHNTVPLLHQMGYFMLTWCIAKLNRHSVNHL